MVSVKVVTDLLQDPQAKEAAEWLTVRAIKEVWKRIFGRKPTAEEQRIVLASMEDIHKYDEKIAAIERRRNPTVAAQRKRGATRYRRARVANYSVARKRVKAKAKRRA